MDGQVFDIPEEYVKQATKFYNDISEIMFISTEECSELIKAISKQRRSSRHPDFNLTPQQARAQIIEEVTHVATCLGMLKQIFNISQEEIEGQVYHKACLSHFDQSNYVYKSDKYAHINEVRKSIETSD